MTIASLRGGLAPSSALLPCMGAPPHAPGDFLMRRKSPKTHQEPPGSWTSGTRGRTPLDSPAPCPSGIGCGGLNLQASSGASHLPSHGLAAGSVTPGKTRGEKKTDLPTQLKVANRSFVVAESSPARDGAQRSEREKGGGHAPGDSKGRSPWRAFGDFPRDGKVTRVQGGAPASGVAGATSPAKTPGVGGAERPPRGRQLAPARNQCANWVQAQPALGLIFFIE